MIAHHSTKQKSHVRKASTHSRPFLLLLFFIILLILMDHYRKFYDNSSCAGINKLYNLISLEIGNGKRENTIRGKIKGGEKRRMSWLGMFKSPFFHWRIHSSRHRYTGRLFIIMHGSVSLATEFYAILKFYESLAPPVFILQGAGIQLLS